MNCCVSMACRDKRCVTAVGFQYWLLHEEDGRQQHLYPPLTVATQRRYVALEKKKKMVERDPWSVPSLLVP
jgi:hypothetical protein